MAREELKAERPKRKDYIHQTFDAISIRAHPGKIVMRYSDYRHRRQTVLARNEAIATHAN